MTEKKKYGKTAKKNKKAGSGRSRKRENSGKLRIGDSWNAITIIALSQNNPLKAIAEFVENSIDAHAENITIVRGREKGELYLKVIDDGEGIPLDETGLPDYKYVATHICDSIKKRLKKEGVKGLQGEFGIGLLSFWTVGEHLILSSAGSDEKTYQMEMSKEEQGYTVSQKKSLFSHSGTELVIRPLLPGIRQLNGERIQHYLASELRDRIKKSGVKIKILDRYSHKKYDVVPRQFTGRHLHEFDIIETKAGDIYIELYLNCFLQENSVSLYRSGTRILESLSELARFNTDPWTSGYLQGMIDVPFLQLTPATRTGIIRDEYFQVFTETVSDLEEKLKEIIRQVKQAEEEEASKNILKSVQRALKEAFLMLPREEYDWFDIYSEIHKAGKKGNRESLFPDNEDKPEEDNNLKKDGGAGKRIGETDAGKGEKAFYEYAGDLYKAVISPSACMIKVEDEKNFRCIPRDRKGRIVEENIEISWTISEGEGTLKNNNGEIVTFKSPSEPGITIIKAAISQGSIKCMAEAVVTITDSLIKQPEQIGMERDKGIPGYTFLRAPAEIWRSKYDDARNLIIINNGHKDYIFSAQKKSRKLRYICRLFSKELVLKNFPGFNSDDLLEHFVELSLYAEENLH